MDFVNINPGPKTHLRQTFTITKGAQIFFLTYDASCDSIIWNMVLDDYILKREIEDLLKKHLTNQ